MLMPKSNNRNFKKISEERHNRTKFFFSIDFLHSGLYLQTKSDFSREFDLNELKKKENSFLVGDAEHFPFKDESFKVVFSGYGLGFSKKPFLILHEMYRVAKGKIVVRCPHRKSNPVRFSFRLSPFNEEWFNKAAEVLGCKGNPFVTAYEYPIISRLERLLLPNAQMSLLYRALKHLEHGKIVKRLRIPYEIEAWFRKLQLPVINNDVRYVVVYNKPEIFKNCFANSMFVNAKNVTAFHNLSNESLPSFYNRATQQHLQEDVWFAFCHQDFVIEEDLSEKLRGADREAIYGPIGGRLAADTLIGQIVQKDKTTIGSRIVQNTPVQTLDEMCLIIHSDIFKQGLSFDPTFRFHFYGADICMQAYVSGFDVFAIALKCQHKSRTIHGDVQSPEYLSSNQLFKKKWKNYLPVRTTIKLVTGE